MKKALFKGTILGAVIVYLWMMITWVALPWHCATMQKFTDEKVLKEAFIANTTEDGIYVLPNICNSAYMREEGHASLKNGPMVFVAIKRNGFNVDSPAPYIWSFVIYLIGSFLITALLLFSKIEGYWNRVFFITAVGLTVGLLGALPNWNWWGFSGSFVALQIIDLVISWFLAGLAISAVAKRKPVP